MKTYKNLYQQICSFSNLKLAFEKASRKKGFSIAVKNFEKVLDNKLLQLKNELESFEYKPKQLKKFIVRDPKTRVIRKSDFRDRIVHHALINILNPIYEKVFINDSYASRLNKGTLSAVIRFQKFMRKVSTNGNIVVGGGRTTI